MTAYYNEIDPYAAKWLRNLISAGHIADGDVDERSIVDVQPADLEGYDQCHFFAGIGGWSYALRLAGWPDDRPVWSGSCPCQPFSAAGKGKAFNDDRHLWPSWLSLISKCRPATIFGEQVEAAIGWGWLDTVLSDLEQESYAVGTAVLPACGVGAPHIRQRLWFVADAGHPSAWRSTGPAETEGGRTFGHAAGCSASGMADSIGTRLEIEREQSAREERATVERSGAIGELVDSSRDGQRESWFADTSGEPQVALGGSSVPRELEHAASDGREQWRTEPNGRGFVGPWHDADWLPCRDGKARPVEPGTFPLAHGVSGRVGKLRAYGNAIVPQVAAEFISAFANE